MIKRVLYYCNHDISIPDGLGTNEYEFTRLLAERFGKNAWCLLPSTENPIPHLAQVNTISCPPQPRIRELPTYFFQAYKIAQKIDGLCETHNIDLICTRLPEFPLIPWLLIKRFNRPVFVKTLGPWFSFNKNMGLVGRLATSLYSKTAASVLKSCEGIDIGLKELRDELVMLLGEEERVDYVPNAANTDHFSPGKTDPAIETQLGDAWPVLGFLGSFPSLRGATEMVQAAARLKDDYPNLALLVAGWDDNMEEVKEQARQLGIIDRCHFIGWVPYENAPSVVNAMDIGISFFEVEKLSKEGNASQKVRQYLSGGKPVISVHSGHSFLEENDLGSTVDHTDTDQVEAAVRNWIGRLRNEGQELHARLRRYAEDNLSTRSAFDQRLSFWQQRLATRRK